MQQQDSSDDTPRDQSNVSNSSSESESQISRISEPAGYQSGKDPKASGAVDKKRHLKQSQKQQTPTRGKAPTSTSPQKDHCTIEVLKKNISSGSHKRSSHNNQPVNSSLKSHNNLNGGAGKR